MSAAGKGYQSIPFLRFSENSVIYTEVGSFQGGGCFFTKDSPDEVIDAGIEGKIAVFVFGCDWIRLAFELLVDEQIGNHISRNGYEQRNQKYFHSIEKEWFPLSVY